MNKLMKNVAIPYSLDAGSALVFQPTGYGVGTNCWGFESQQVEVDMYDADTIEAASVNAMVLDYVSGTTTIEDGAGNTASTTLPQVAIDPTYNVGIDGISKPSDDGEVNIIHSSNAPGLSSETYGPGLISE